MSQDEARVQRVARAICIASGQDPDFNYDPSGIQRTDDVRWRMFESKARAAIAAATAWLPIETAPKDHKIMVLGTWAGEINGIDDEGPSIYIVKFSGRSDYPGFDWACQDTDAYAAWVKATHWMPLPEPPR